LFLFGSGVALFVLRTREPAVERPFRVPGYPVVPLVFCAGLAFMLYSSVTFAYRMRSIEALWSVGLVAAGILLAVIDARSARNAHPPIE
jgi:amino acid transporter